jgi:hypothetical protein
MISQASLIVQMPRDGAVDRYLRSYPPPSVTSGRVSLEHLAGDAEGRLGPPETGQVVMSVLSPEALRDGQQVQDVVRHAAGTAEPLVIIVQAAEELREDELAAVLAAAAHTHRSVILRVMSDA